MQYRSGALLKLLVITPEPTSGRVPLRPTAMQPFNMDWQVSNQESVQLGAPSEAIMYTVLYI